MVPETVTQADRERAANQITVPPENATSAHPGIVSPRARATAMRSRILAGEADEHPLVQGAAFYRTYPDGYRRSPVPVKGPLRPAPPVLRLSLPIVAASGPFSRDRFDEFFESLVTCGYEPKMRDGDNSIWVGDVCVAEFLGGDFVVYPAAFARFGTPGTVEPAIDMAALLSG